MAASRADDEEDGGLDASPEVAGIDFRGHPSLASLAIRATFPGRIPPAIPSDPSARPHEHIGATPSPCPSTRRGGTRLLRQALPPAGRPPPRASASPFLCTMNSRPRCERTVLRSERQRGRRNPTRASRLHAFGRLGVHIHPPEACLARRGARADRPRGPVEDVVQLRPAEVGRETHPPPAAGEGRGGG